MNSKYTLPLFDEITIFIFTLLSAQELWSFSRTSKEIYKATYNPRLWKCAVKDNFQLDVNDEVAFKTWHQIMHEKKRLYSYWTNYFMIEIKLQNERKLGKFQSPESERLSPQLQAELEERSFKISFYDEFKKMNDFYLHQPNDSCQNPIQEADKKSLDLLKNDHNDWLMLILSHTFEEIIVLKSHLNVDRLREDFNRTIHALCVLDAPILAHLIIKKNNLLMGDNFLAQVFIHPCVAVIERLLNDNKIDLNKKYWGREFDHGLQMHATPLVFAVHCMIDAEKKQLNKSKKIIDLLLEKGTDITLPVFISNDYGDISDEEYQNELVSVSDWCKWILENKLSQFDDAQQPLFEEIMNKIINNNFHEEMISEESSCKNQMNGF